MAQATESRSAERHAFITGFHGLPYQVKDVARAVAFYTQHLGFTLRHQQLPPLRACRLATRRFCSVVPEPPARDRC
jgi:hypothetical protein